MSKHEKEGSDFFPLTVDYEERFYAAGKILGSQYMRREGKPSDEAILSGRIIDRTIRPLFDQRIRHEIQVVITVLALDEYDPDVLGVIAASLALGVSNIPWNGPVSAVRVLKEKNSNDFLLNPNYEIRKKSQPEIEMVACGKDGNINMIEVASFETGEKTAVDALRFASEAIEKIQNFQKEIIAERGATKRILELQTASDSIISLFKENIEESLEQGIFGNGGKESFQLIEQKWSELVKERIEEKDHAVAYQYLDEKINDLVHEQAIKNGKRADGRGIDEIRPLFVQAGGISPVLHGSGIFFRGATHVLGVLTLGSPKDIQTIEGMEEQSEKRFMLHYNFPPYSTGEVGKIGNTNRRMIGHGALAEKALAPMIPSKELFPYTIRLVAEALASNGSTSMASVCAGTIALLDGGVPMLRPVAGIASGLMMKNAKEYVVLTDIQGPEDHHGDMDFKVAGTREGITAVQMDVKVEGVPIAILAEAFEKARIARLKILDEIEKVIKSPRTNISPRAPKILVHKIKVDQIGLVIGPGGKTINAIIDKTGAEINIEEDGTVFVTGKNGAAEKALAVIQAMTHEYAKGERFEGVVTKIMEFGAFVKIAPGTEGLVHVSEIASFKIDKVDNYLKEGELVPVIIKEIDEKKRINLSIKLADPAFIKPFANGPKQ
jgi:polyribonucleotide nucleotidyltransferase